MNRSLPRFAVAAIAFLAQLHAQTARPKPASTAQLEAVSPIVSQFEDGAGLEGGQKFVVGESGFFRFSVVNFKASDTGKVQLSGHAQVFDSRGVPIAPVDDLNIVTALSEEDKNWRPRFHFQFQLPAIAPPGAYKIHFEVTDEQSHQTASGDAAFGVEGGNVPPSDTLVIRHITFYRNADDEVPLSIIAYRPADAIWIRFDITGYKHGEQNSIDVSYDVAVRDASGKELFVQENAATEKSQAFYPQPWVPGSFSLKLQPDTARGVYAVTITAHDTIGRQTAAEKAEFRVE